MKSTKKKVSEAAVTAMECKIKELTERLLQSKKKLSEHRSECRRLRKKNKELRNSRDNWCAKAKSRREVTKSLKKSVLYYKGKRRSKWHQYTDSLIVLVVLLRVKAGCSYKKIRSVLGIYTFYFSDTLASSYKFPTDRTMQNWVSKWGYYHLKQADSEFVREKVCLIIDESISVGNESLLLCLICPSDRPRDSALCYEDVRVLGMKGKKSWTGALISEFVSELLAEKDYEVEYIVSDEGRNIKKGVQLLKKEHLFDISHAVARCLKKTFEKKVSYQNFTKDVRTYQSKLSNGYYSYLRPPKQRGKARFMNQAKLVNWAMKINSKWSTFDDKVKQIFEKMPSHQKVIEELNDCIELSNKIANPLKVNGLTVETIIEAFFLLKQRSHNQTTKVFLQYLRPYLEKYKAFANQEEWKNKRITVCSDIIESFFGTYKIKQSDNYFNGVTAVTLELPLLCLSKETLCQKPECILEGVKTSDLKDWLDEHSTDNQNIKRIDFFKN